MPESQHSWKKVTVNLLVADAYRFTRKYSLFGVIINIIFILGSLISVPPPFIFFFKKITIWICNWRSENAAENYSRSCSRCKCRSSRSQMFFKIGVLRNFAIFTVKQLCWSLFLIKLQDRSSCNFIKKRLQHRCFPVNTANFLRTPILQNSSEGCFYKCACSLDYPSLL